VEGCHFLSIGCDRPQLVFYPAAMRAIEGIRQQLLDWFAPLDRCAVAYSGGVDSAVVAKAAHLVLGDRALAVTGTSASLAAGELDNAIAVARQIGIRHEIVATREFDNESYLRNAPDRCYHCKTELYTRLEQLMLQRDVGVIVNGANADDAGDYRPGMRAASEHKVRSPLLECGFTKTDVRNLAANWSLPVWDKPASPCLSSRVAYGESVTPERLTMIDEAEQFLRNHDFPLVRVRYHSGDMARIEVPIENLARILEGTFREQLIQRLRQLGFRFITLDIEGFRSGSLNSLVPLSTKSKPLIDAK
jgi:uncharacterized protein